MNIVKEVYPHELVKDQNYFRDVRGNMGAMISEKELRRVRFGLSGEGVAPNYQVSTPGETEKYPFSGLSHKPDQRTLEAYDDANLTDPFTWEDVQQMLERVIKTKESIR